MERQIRSTRSVEKQLGKVHKRVRKGLIFSARAGAINIIWDPHRPEVHRLRIIEDWLGRSAYFTRAVPAAEVKVKTIKPDYQTQSPRPLIVSSPIVTLDQITRSLHS